MAKAGLPVYIHLHRGCTWEHVGPAVVRAESKAVDCAFAIMAQARMNGPPTEQLTLPMRHGGLGLAHTGPEEGDAAHLSAVAITQLLQDLMQHLSPRVCTILGSQARLYINDHDWAGSTFRWFDLCKCYNEVVDELD
jgi:hypothetical protein